MIEVTVKLTNPPVEGKAWYLYYGTETPYSAGSSAWKVKDTALVNEAYILSLEKTDYYIRVIVVGEPYGARKYLYESTKLWTFVDGQTYVWDAKANTLSLETPVAAAAPFTDAIFSLVWDFSTWLKDWADSIWSWIPGNEWFHDRLYNIADWVWSLLTPIANFGDWVNDVATKVSAILASEGILGLIKGWFPWIEDFGTWFSNVSLWFETGWNAFWKTTIPTVEGWIATATEGLPALKVSVGNFFTVTLPTLFDLKYAEEWWKGKSLGVYNLITSTLSVWFPDYDDLVVLWANTKLFFANPLDWLLEQFTDWFLGKE